MSKYEKKEYASATIRFDEVSVYPQKAMQGKITYGGLTVDEQKRIPVLCRLVHTPPRPPQFVFEVQGEYHVEEIAHAAISPDFWRSYAKFWFNQQESWKMIDFLIGCKVRMAKFLNGECRNFTLP